MPLPGADVRLAERGGFRGFAKRLRATAPAAVDETLVLHFLHRYGTRASELVALAAADPDAARRLVPPLPYVRVEAAHAAAAEMAATLDDVLRRRVPIAFRDPAGGVEVSEDVARLMRAALGWTAEETAQAVAAYRAGIERERAQRLDGRALEEPDVERRRA